MINLWVLKQKSWSCNWEKNKKNVSWLKKVKSNNLIAINLFNDYLKRRRRKKWEVI